MLNLANSTTDKLQLVTDAAQDVDVVASYADLSGTTITLGRQVTSITTATTTDIVATPAASTVRNVKTLHIRNKDTGSVTVTVVHDANGTDYEIHEEILLPGEGLQYVEGRGFEKLGELAGQYQAYTPTWTSTGTAPAIGNATATARYSQSGDRVHVYGQITFGSSSSFGTGNYLFALPVDAASSHSSAILYGGIVFLFDSSTSNSTIAEPRWSGAQGTFQINYPATYLGVDTGVGVSAPWAWAQSDIIAWNFAYEAA